LIRIASGLQGSNFAYSTSKRWFGAASIGDGLDSFFGTIKAVLGVNSFGAGVPVKRRAFWAVRLDIFRVQPAWA
jgi:hypothetical protein